MNCLQINVSDYIKNGTHQTLGWKWACYEASTHGMVELTISKRIRAVHGSKNWDGKQDKELRNLTDK